MKPIIFTLVGKDKPGLVDSLAKTVYDLGGNWLASNFSHMAGQFAGFVQVDLPAEKTQSLVDAFGAHPDLNIQLISGDSEEQSQKQVICIDIMGNDKPGIVRELTSVLHQFNLNILNFESGCGSAPNWGSSLFRAHTKIEVSSDFDTDPLRDALEDIANDLVVDISLK